MKSVEMYFVKRVVINNSGCAIVEQSIAVAVRDEEVELTENYSQYSWR